MRELLKLKPRTEDIKQEIYFRFKHDIELFVNDFLTRSVDVNKDKGMQKCYLETWQACATEIGHLYFNKYKYLRKPRQDGEVKRGEVRGQEFEDELLPIGIEVYEDFCNLYRKQFFIYDCCKFLGMNMDSMYKLSEMRTDLLKKAHTKQEGSMRTALASGRSNVTAMAILLNHDYDYTRTTQVIHTTGSDKLNAENLPTLEAKPQDIDSGRHSSMITDSGDNM